ASTDARCTAGCCSRSPAERSRSGRECSPRPARSLRDEPPNDSRGLRPGEAGCRAEAGVRATAYVLLEDGTRFDGLACGAGGHAIGEIVFTTSMSGYQEAM